MNIAIMIFSIFLIMISGYSLLLICKKNKDIEMFWLQIYILVFAWILFIISIIRLLT
jgi:hypothetical protein